MYFKIVNGENTSLVVFFFFSPQRCCIFVLEIGINFGRCSNTKLGMDLLIDNYL